MVKTHAAATPASPTSGEPATEQQYYDQYIENIEAALTDAVNSCMERMPQHPLAYIGTALLKEGVDSSTPVGNDADLQIIRNMVAPTMAKRQKSFDQMSGAATPISDGAVTPDQLISDCLRPISYTTASWLQSANVESIVTQSLLAPLKELTGEKEQSRDSMEPEVEQAWIQSLGEHHDEQPIVKLLMDADVLAKLASNLYTAARKLATRQAQPNGDDFASKFFEKSAANTNLELGNLDTFFGGLDTFLGPPNPNLDDAVEAEHCAAEDSRLVFTTPDYHTRTTPQVEYWFVKEPSAEKLQHLALSAWPSEELSAWPPQESERMAAGGAQPDGLPAGEANEDRRVRKARPLADFEDEINERNSRLRERNMEELKDVEIVCARLFSGPQFIKYNRVLRDIGQLRSKQGVEQNFKKVQHLSAALREYQHQVETRWNATMPRGQRSLLSGHTQGNLYTTTLHVANSAVLKLGKLTRASVVYRGISSSTLPVHWRRKDAESLTRGGVEFGFTSCSADKSEAIRYAAPASEQANRTPIILEIQQGMIDRGAEMAWISQCALSQSHNRQPSLHAIHALCDPAHSPRSPRYPSTMQVSAREGSFVSATDGPRDTVPPRS